MTDGLCDDEWVAAAFMPPEYYAASFTCTDGTAVTVQLRATDAVGHQDSQSYQWGVSTTVTTPFS